MTASCTDGIAGRSLFLSHPVLPHLLEGVSLFSHLSSYSLWLLPLTDTFIWLSAGDLKIEVIALRCDTNILMFAPQLFLSRRFSENFYANSWLFERRKCYASGFFAILWYYMCSNISVAVNANILECLETASYSSSLRTATLSLSHTHTISALH